VQRRYADAAVKIHQLMIDLRQMDGIAGTLPVQPKWNPPPPESAICSLSNRPADSPPPR